MEMEVFIEQHAQVIIGIGPVYLVTIKMNAAELAGILLVKADCDCFLGIKF